MSQKSWYTIQAASKGVANIDIHHEIGFWGVSAAQFLRDLNAVEADVINLSVNSPGGDLFEGFAMRNGLRAHSAKVYGEVVGLAASAATIVLMGADHISMPDGSLMMIHNPWSFAMGDADEFRKAADDLEKFQNMMVNIYAERASVDRDELIAMMKAETFLEADEALAAGLIDSVTDKIDIAAKVRPFADRFGDQLPIARESDIFRIEAINTVKDFEQYLRDAGISRKAAEALVARSKSLCDAGEPEGEVNSDDDQAGAILARFDQVKIPASLATG